MRILFCTWQYHPVVAGGAERQARLQAEELVRRGHQVTVVCPRVEAATSGTVDGVSVVRLRRFRGEWSRRLTYFGNLFRFVLQHGGRYDVVHVHLANLQADAVVAAARARRRPTHVKVANSGIHGEMQRLARLARVTRWYGLRHASSVQALSEETRQELLRIGVQPERIVSIPNGVPAPDVLDRATARGTVGLLADGKVLLFLGRFAGYKGLGDLLAVWPRVAREGWTLLLVGEEAEDEPFGPLPGLPGLVVHPWTTSPRAYFAAADVFVLPSHSEGMSNALLEAMASGCAVVTSDTGAATEMVEDGISGLVHPTGDVDGLAAALDKVMSDEALRDRLATGARERVDDFSVAHVVDRLEEVYRRIGRR